MAARKSSEKTPTKPGNTANRANARNRNRDAENKRESRREREARDEREAEGGTGKAGAELPSPTFAEKGRTPPKDRPEGYGPNVAPDPSLGDRENELRELAVEQPVGEDLLPDPRMDESDLPPGVAVGGAVVRHRDDTPSDKGKPKANESRGRVLAQPVRVDGRNVRNDDDALEGHAVTIIGGEHEGQKAHFVHATEYDEKDGYPTFAFVRFADTTYHTACDVVEYKHLRPANRYVG